MRGGRQVGVEEWGEAGWCGGVGGRQVGVEGGGSMHMNKNCYEAHTCIVHQH